jgi:hypothetical protein
VLRTVSSLGEDGDLGSRMMDECAAIEIADEEVRLAVATPLEDGFAVRCLRRPIPPGSVRSGWVADTEAVVQATRSLLGNLPVRPREISLVLSGKHIMCRTERVAASEVESALSAAKQRMRRYVVFGGESTVVAHAEPRDSTVADDLVWLTSAVAHRDYLESQLRIAKRCGLRLARAEPAMLSLARTLVGTGDERPRFLLRADIDRAEIGAVRQDGLFACETMPIDAKVLAQDGARLVATLEQLADYHLRHAGGREPIDELLCSTTSGSFDGLFARLRDAGVSADWLDPAKFDGIRSLEGDGTDSAADRALLASVVAAALSNAQGYTVVGEVDLLPEPSGNRRSPLLRPWVVVPVVLTMLISVGLLTWEWLTVRDARRLQSVLEHPTPAMLECGRLQIRESRVKRDLEDAKLLLASVPRTVTTSFLAELPRRLPSDLWLQRIEIQPLGRATVEGMAHADDIVFRFSDALLKSPYVETVHVGGTGSERNEDVILTWFRLEITLVKPTAKQEHAEEAGND